MGWLLVASSTGVEVGGFFGRAEASARQVNSEQIELVLSVEAEAGEAVIAHLIEPGTGQQALPLPETSTGVYKIIIEVRKVNYTVVFELLGSGVGSQSQPFQLTDLGVMPAVLGILTNAPAEIPESSPARSWGWVGLGLAALSLMALAFWAWPNKEQTPSDFAKTEADVTL